MNRFMELSSSRRFIRVLQTDETSNMRVSSDIEVQTHQIKIHKFENTLT